MFVGAEEEWWRREGDCAKPADLQRATLGGVGEFGDGDVTMMMGQ